MKRFDSKVINREAFLSIDEYTDSFFAIKDIQCDLMYGNLCCEGEPWLTIVLPTFNREHLFTRALASVLQQKDVKFYWDILVVDNTSLDRDGSTPALKEIQRIGNSRVSYVHNSENIGSGYNWNRGVELAQGEWICFLHDDDVLCHDALYNIGRQIASYRGKRPLGYLHARRLEYPEKLLLDTTKHFPPERLSRFGFLVAGCTGAGSPSCGTVILKKAYLEIGGINYAYGPSADAVLCYQIMKKYAVICSDRILGGYRWDNNETLEKSTLLKMIQADELLSRFSYQQSPFAKWWGKVFGAASSWRNIHRKQVVAQKNGITVTKEDFRKVTAYPEPTKQKKLIFLGIYALYRLWRLADGWVRQLIIEIIGGGINDEAFGKKAAETER